MGTPTFRDNRVLGKFTAADTADALTALAGDVKATVIETCAKVAEIHRIRNSQSEYQVGYNQAVADIAAKIRELA